MVVVSESINQYPIRKRVSKIQNTVFLGVLRSSSAPYIINPISSLLHIHPVHKCPINTFMTIPDVIGSIPATPGHFCQITPIPTTKQQSHRRAYSHSVRPPSATWYSSIDSIFDPLQLPPTRFWINSLDSIWWLNPFKTPTRKCKDIWAEIECIFKYHVT